MWWKSEDVEYFPLFDDFGGRFFSSKRFREDLWVQFSQSEHFCGDLWPMVDFVLVKSMIGVTWLGLVKSPYVKNDMP